MSVRPCLEPGCPVLTRKSRCPTHERARDKARGTRQERGYGPEHDALRANWQRILDSGVIVYCWRCRTHDVLTPIDPNHWHLGHDDQDRTQYRGPECPPCNLATSGRRISPDA